MKTVFVAMLAILAGSLVAGAQAPAPAKGTLTKDRDAADMQKLQAKLDQVAASMSISPCPVSMQAKQRGMTEMVKTGRNEAPAQRDYMPAPAQHIHLILRGFAKDRPVTAGTVLARGRSARAHAEGAQLVGEAPSDLRRTLDVTFTDNGDGTVSADLDLPAFTSVNAVQLQSITYSDGSNWKLDNGNVCMVAPDPIMLIAGR
ncbi:MAG TPA: hypothetical protein VKB38_11830 [Terracidiphilus sp.]|nr:hypothetical protein [Terracidiphilus sp.]